MVVSTGDATDVGGGDCSYTGSLTVGANLPGGDSQNGNSIDIVVNGVSVLFSNCNPCASQTFNFNFVAPCGSVAEIGYIYDGNGNGGGTECSVSENLALGTLPVTLASFDAKYTNHSVNISWSTSLEVNNRGFEILKSKNGRDFEVLTFVEGQVNSNELNRYQFEDSNVVSGNYYYALKQIDLNGNTALSETISIKLNAESIKTSVYPNPLVNRTLNVSAEGNGEIEIFNQLGQLVFSSQYQVGENKLNLEDLETGSYIYKLSVDNQLIDSNLLIIK